MTATSGTPDAAAVTPKVRTRAERRHDSIHRLEHDKDVWMATGSAAGGHLVPLSLCWHDGEVLVAVADRSVTSTNVRTGGRARLALGDTRDVVMIDAAGVVVEHGTASEPLFDAFVARTRWDIRAEGGSYVLIRLRPERMQAWRNEEEIGGRTLMKDGRWLD